ncbi:hypothetical protein IMSHALPRED_008363 [Imshaugia aleurites]|uniref:Uncharacterized protein n=1 Tax=Imshaugia aleurites TaxID=172621 RepID=A0A8H3IDB8_9LECA|nr:hypothetical protein IMSHALPRED_008363 [Imshaugia aleurites]
MFSFLDPKSPASKAYVSHGTLPPYVDPEQPPSKKKPFSTISSLSFIHTVQLVLPQELYDVVWKDVEAKISNTQYSRVIMSLSEILEGDFFNKYIKIGNILMLSEGRPGVDDCFSLKDGILRLELAKDRYERCGLVGESIRDAGRKHIKTRYAVELDLRPSSMLHGKKGFERIVWAFKNVLTQSVTWLFHDFNSSTEHDAPITKHHPVIKECSLQQRTTARVRVPNLTPPYPSDSNDGFEYWTLGIYEWLGLVTMESPRILSEDIIDPFLSRYEVPHNDSRKAFNVVTLTWTGFIPALWLKNLMVYLSCAKTTNWKGQSKEDFFALSAHSFKTAVADQKDACTVLCLLDGSMNSHNVVAAADKIKESGDLKAVERQGKEYVLWELSLG